MKHLATVLLVGGGGFIGANLRYWIGGLIQSRAGADFPWQTMFANVTGSLVIGLFLGLMAGSNWNPNWRLFVAIGVLGGYTTYSSFSWESVAMLTEGQFGRAGVYIAFTAIGSVMAAWLGLVAARAMLGGRA
ncbi:MAG TPA: fluoride efflux transporter CrcB [Fimbriimonadaceae bacterium]|nr:fluoride efflux transporter CrcB [Fimbriimonadaceae bacterium]